jgi:glycosyltransferase involved in cell wall biosynthesis
VDAKNARQLADGLKRFLLMSQSSMKKMGARGHVKIRQNFTWDKIVGDVVRVYRQLVLKSSHS